MLVTLKRQHSREHAARIEDAEAQNVVETKQKNSLGKPFVCKHNIRIFLSVELSQTREH